MSLGESVGKMEGKTNTRRGSDVPRLTSQAADGLCNNLGPCYQIWHFALWVTYSFQPGMTCLQVCEITTGRCATTLVGAIPFLGIFETTILVFKY